MAIPTDDILTELGRWVMEAAILRHALDDQQQETARMATEVGALRQRHEKLSQTAIEQEENLIALNQRLMGKSSWGNKSGVL